MVVLNPDPSQLEWNFYHCSWGIEAQSQRRRLSESSFLIQSLSLVPPLIPNFSRSSNIDLYKVTFMIRGDWLIWYETAPPRAQLTMIIIWRIRKRKRPSGQWCVLMHFLAYPIIEMREVRGGNLSTAIATCSGRNARELFWCNSWLFIPSWSFLYIKFSISGIFYKSITDIRTDGRTNGRTHPLIEMRGRI